jgi:hypothetical protein
MSNLYVIKIYMQVDYEFGEEETKMSKFANSKVDDWSI